MLRFCPRIRGARGDAQASPAIRFLQLTRGKVLRCPDPFRDRTHAQPRRDPSVRHSRDCPPSLVPYSYSIVKSRDLKPEKYVCNVIAHEGIFPTFSPQHPSFGINAHQDYGFRYSQNLGYSYKRSGARWDFLPTLGLASTESGRVLTRRVGCRRSGEFVCRHG
jgi:hypothetical protein